MFLSAQNITETIEKTENFFSKMDFEALFHSLVNWFAGVLGSIILSLVVWIVGKHLKKMLLRLLKRTLEKGNLEVGVIKFIMSLCNFAGNLVLILLIVDILGFETTSFIAFLGSAGLAVGMSLQGSLSNFAGGILILMSKPFVVGDYIISSGQEGRVTEIDLLYTRLLTIDNKVVIIPNGTLSNANIVNVGAEPTRRLDIEIGVAYSADVQKAKQLLMEVLDSDSRILQGREKLVIVKSLDASCVTLESRVWVNTDVYWDVRFALLEKYKEVFDANGVEIPFQQVDVHVR